MEWLHLAGQTSSELFGQLTQVNPGGGELASQSGTLCRVTNNECSKTCELFGGQHDDIAAAVAASAGQGAPVTAGTAVR
jgi:hypothetical protein